MPLIVDIPPELETKIARAAERSGVSENDFVRSVLEEKLRADSEPGTDRQTPSRLIAHGLPVRDRSREYAWIERHRSEYDGKYVALDGDKLLAVGDGVKEVMTRTRELGIEGALIVYVEGSDRPRFISGGVV